MSEPTDHLVPIECEQLEHGMYVAELDRSWLDTPFEERGFTITQDRQISILRRCCDYVYVNPARSEPAKDPGIVVTSDDGKELASAERVLELNGCHGVVEDACSQVAATIRAARRIGSLDIEPIDTKIDGFVEHVLAWPDAMQWVLATEPGDGYLTRRSVGTAVLSIIFGKHLGLDRGALRDLAFGALLLDIGKTNVPITILSKPHRLNAAERSFARRHVEGGVSLVRLDTRLDRRIVEMVGAHHERMDGSGYPHRISGTEIPFFARIAAIADTFDAMTQDRGYASARSGHAALRHLNTWREVRFDAALVDEFVQAIGVYPVGTGVELADGTFGIVCQQDPSEPKRPFVLVLRNRHGDALDLPYVAEPAPNHRVRRALPASVGVN